MAEDQTETNGNNRTGRDSFKKEGGGRGRNQGRGGGGRGRSRSPIGTTSGSSAHSSRVSRRVYVANIPFDVKWNELKDLFRDKIGNVTYCQLFEDEQGRSRGCGLVEFNDAASAQKAIEILHRYEFRNREMVVKEDLDCERDRCGRLILPGNKNNSGGDEIRSNRGGGGGPPDQGLHGQQGFGHEINYGDHSTGTWNTYGLSTQFLESLGIRGPLNHRIFVANLDYKVGEKKLEEIFRLAGKVLRVRLYTDSQGVSKGHGTVEFEHPVEAVQAISMFHDQKLYGRGMSIRMDKYEAEEVPEILPAKLPSGLDGIGKGLGIGGQPLNVSKSLLGNQSVAPPPTVPTPSGLSSVGVGPPSMSGQLSNSGGNLNLPNVASLAPLINSITSGGMIGGPGVGSGLDRSSFAASLSNQPMVSSTLQPNVGGGLNSYSSLNNNRAPLNSAPLGAVQSVGAGFGGGYERDYRTAATDTVLVRNLPPTVSWQSLRDRFNEVADVRYAELKGVGVAVVRFMNERDASRAVDTMNRAQFENRMIEVVPYYAS